MSKLERSSDVVVVGGGVIGLAVAWRIIQRGLSVTVLERGAPGQGTSHVAAGMVAPIAEADPAERPLLALALRSARMYGDFVAELERFSGREGGFLACGTLLVARDGDEAAALIREAEMRERLGLAVRRLRPSQARALEPGLAPGLRGALEFAGDHAVDPRRLVQALGEAVRAGGGRVVAGAPVASLLGDEHEGVRGVRVAGREGLDGEFTAPAVVIAAGPWSGEIELPEHARVSLRPVKGQILRLHDPAGPGLLTRVLRMQRGYIVPRGDGRYVLGATTEERGFDTSVTAGAAFELLRDAIELLPGLGECVLDELSAGVRPGTLDNLPVIGPGALPGLHWATGHYRHGIMLAPLTAELLAAWVAGEDPADLLADEPLGAGSSVLEAVSPRRFAVTAVAR
ncbi:MAG: glycine oxidase ThiO [Solirubrobacteraceae bacterium]